MTVAQLARGLEISLLALGLLFLAVNLRVGSEILRWWRRRTGALLVWTAPKPPYYALNLAIGVMLGLLLFVTVFVVPRPASSVFGELMMFLYYGYLLPFSTRIMRGLYADGVWTDSGFMAYADIGGLSWKDDTAATLVVASRVRAIARTLTVPGTRLGEVRRLLREKIGDHAIELEGGPGSTSARGTPAKPCKLKGAVACGPRAIPRRPVASHESPSGAAKTAELRRPRSGVP